MKKKTNWLMILLVFTFSSIILIFFYKNLRQKSNQSNQSVAALLDSVELFHFQKIYLTQLISSGFIENDRKYTFNNILTYALSDGKKQSPESLVNIFGKAKKTIVIRYTEIGCNACADSTFAYAKKYKKVDSLYRVLVLVDFSNYDAYLKWKKISEIEYPIMWIKKGDMPFTIESGSSSYIFTVNHSLEVNNFFVPNSKFTNFIDMYFRNLQFK